MRTSLSSGTQRTLQTYDREEAHMQVTRKDTRRQVAEETFEKTGDSMRIPVLLRPQKVDISLYR